MSDDISPHEYRSVVGVPDLRPSKEFWNVAREQLGVTEQYGYDEKSLLFEKGKPYMGRETTGEDSIEVKLHCQFDDLSRAIAIETGQAKEIHPGIIEFKQPHIYYLGRESHVAVVGDKWQPEICREPLVHVQRGLGASFHPYPAQEQGLEIER